MTYPLYIFSFLFTHEWNYIEGIEAILQPPITAPYSTITLSREIEFWISERRRGQITWRTNGSGTLLCFDFFFNLVQMENLFNGMNTWFPFVLGQGRLIEKWRHLVILLLKQKDIFFLYFSTCLVIFFNVIFKNCHVICHNSLFLFFRTYQQVFYNFSVSTLLNLSFGQVQYVDRWVREQCAWWVFAKKTLYTSN